MAFKLTGTSSTNNLYIASSIQNSPINLLQAVLGNIFLYSGTSWGASPNFVSTPVTGVIDPNTNFTVITSTSNNAIYSMQNPTGNYNSKTIILQGTDTANISTPLGTLQLTPSNNTAILVYNNIWQRYNTNSYKWFVSKYVSNVSGSSETFDSQQAFSISLSGNGSLLASGGPNDNNGVGAVWIFSTSGGSWAPQKNKNGNKILPDNYIGSTPRIGSAVSLSTDGQTLAFSAPYENNRLGAVWIFVYSSFSLIWNQMIKIVASDYIGSNIYQGYSLALNQNGSVLIFSSPYDNTNIGACWIYTGAGNAWSQQAKLTPSGNTGAPNFGTAVAINYTGNTVAIGGYSDDSYVGATWIFTKNNNIWSQQAKLVGNSVIGISLQGFSVALSSDGNTVAIGGFYDNNQVGATWIFTRTSNIWTQQAKLIGTSSGTPSQGSSVSLSSDGNVLSVGGGWTDTQFTTGIWIFSRIGTVWTQINTFPTYLYNLGAIQPCCCSLSSSGKILGFSGYSVLNYVGAVSCYTNTNNTWSLQGITTGIGTQGTTTQGNYVSISYDGNIIAESTINDTGGVGAVWIFNRTNTTYTQQGTKLQGIGYTGRSFQGTSLCLSNDGLTLAVGGIGDNGGIGAVWIFTFSSPNWLQQGNKLVGTGNIGNSSQGRSVALSSDGNTVAIGGNSDNGGIGAVWIFTRTSGVWTQQTKLVGTGNIGASGQGYSVSLSGNGTILAVGGATDNGNIGATWIFYNISGTWTQISKLVGTDNIGNTLQGFSVSLSSLGNTLAVGGAYDNGFYGATWIFVIVSGDWVQQAKLIGSNGVQAFQGLSVSLTGDGNTLAVGGRQDNSNLGAIWIFTRTSGEWTQQGNKLTSNLYLEGRSVCLSGNGNIMVVGAQGNTLVYG